MRCIMVAQASQRHQCPQVERGLRASSGMMQQDIEIKEKLAEQKDSKRVERVLAMI